MMAFCGDSKEAVAAKLMMKSSVEDEEATKY
jgi:hypothetical protein